MDNHNTEVMASYNRCFQSRVTKLILFMRFCMSLFIVNIKHQTGQQNEYVMNTQCLITRGRLAIYRFTGEMVYSWMF